MIHAKVVDWGALGATIWQATLAGVGVSIIVAISVRSYARSHDLRLEGNAARASAHVAVAVLTGLLAVGAAGYGLYLITD